MTRDQMTSAWWRWCEKNSRVVTDSLPTFEEFKENILPTLETVDTEEKSDVY